MLPPRAASPVTSQALPWTTMRPDDMVLPVMSWALPKTSMVGPFRNAPRLLPGVPLMPM